MGFIPAALSGGKSIIDVVEDYEASIAEASKVFSFSGINFDDDSMLMLVFDMAATAALNLNIRINTVATGNYNTDGYNISAGVETLVDLNSQTAGQLVSSTLFSAAQVHGFGVVFINLPLAGNQGRPTWLCSVQGSAADNEEMKGVLTTAQTTITDIELLTSASTWQIGSRATLYKVKRLAT